MQADPIYMRKRLVVEIGDIQRRNSSVTNCWPRCVGLDLSTFSCRNPLLTVTTVSKYRYLCTSQPYLHRFVFPNCKSTVDRLVFLQGSCLHHQHAVDWIGEGCTIPCKSPRVQPKCHFNYIRRQDGSSLQHTTMLRCPKAIDGTQGSSWLKYSWWHQR